MIIKRQKMEKFVNNYENKMPCDRVIWMLIFLGGCQVMEKEEAGGEMLEYSIVDEKKFRRK